MLKRYLTIGILSLTLASGYAFPEFGPDQADSVAVEQLANGNELVNSDAVDSKETNTIEVSETARKMRQMEKAKNLEENDSFGGSLTLIAMVIVICALALLSILFLIFGNIAQHFLTKTKNETAAKVGKDTVHTKEDLASAETIAAIGLAIAEHMGQGHDIEDTILTIHQIKKSYSPWNSKIYNLRETPALRRNVRK